jgi:hypothetical protein
MVNSAGLMADQRQHYENVGLRIRTAAKFGSLGWLIVYYNGKTDAGVGNITTVWRETEDSVRGNDGAVTFSLDTSVFYYVQYDANEDVGVVTFRSNGYEGPILFGLPIKNISEEPTSQTQLYIGNTWNPASLTIDEIHVDQFSP